MPSEPDIISSPSPAQKSESNWTPNIGEEADELVKRKLGHESHDARAAVLSSAASILSKSVDPQAERGSETGLVVGYVQSGKTLSPEVATSGRHITTGTHLPPRLPR